MTKKKTKKQKLAVIDFETDPFLYDRIPKPFCVEFYSDEITQIFWGVDCAENLSTFLKSLETEYLIYAHNGGKFDFHFLHSNIDNPALVIKSRIVECKLFHHTLRDSFAILPVPLRDFEKLDIEYWKMEEQYREKYKAEILEYLHVDCLSLFRAVSAFIDRFGLQMTIGGTAIKEIRKLHPFRNQGSAHDAIFRPYYYGGRVECWKGGILDGPWKLVDRNSMYPAVMATEKHPINGNFDFSTNLPDNFDRPYFIHFRGTNRNALCSRGDNGDLVFNKTYGEFFVCSHEIKTALEYNLITIDEVFACYIAQEWTTFDTFVYEHAKAKELAKRSGDVLNYVFEKLLMNSGYGRTGINPARFEDWILHRDFGNEGILELNGYSQQADYGNLELWSKPADIKEDDYCDVSICASITSAARANLLEAIQCAINPIYCDTDSIICSDFMGDLDSYRLGAWDIEKEAETAAIAGRKLYCLYSGDKVHKISSKGGTLSKDEIIRICNGETVDYFNQAPSFSIKGDTKFIQRRFKSTLDLSTETGESDFDENA